MTQATDSGTVLIIKVPSPDIQYPYLMIGGIDVVGGSPVTCVIINSHRCAVLLKINHCVYLAQVMVCWDKGVKDELILIAQHRRIARS
ncbi:MAG TPA: hypothetical protein VGJ87_12180 [Roseiflexaceae bacterium]